MYDIVIAGAGIGAATLCHKLKRVGFKICVVDVRDHLGGNCYDYRSGGGRVHAYGPHIMHCPVNSTEVLHFLMSLCAWQPYEHRVEAEIKLDGKFIRTPFPYSKLTEQQLGRALSPEEVIDLYFRGYSQKMWKTKYEDLPESIKGRVPKDTVDTPKYFPNQFVGFPVGGYTRMMENMFDGTDVILRAEQDTWVSIPAKRYVYCGRPDRLLDTSQRGLRLGNMSRITGDIKGAHWLDYQTLDISFGYDNNWQAKAPVLNFCHQDTDITRITHYGALRGDTCNVTSTERPLSFATPADLNPFYPFPTTKNLEIMQSLRTVIATRYPNLHLLGRLAQYKYIDMYQAIGAALKLASELNR